ncbi:MAG TPA: hypothetical protein VK533_04815 [Sphingomonas sp.]|uniref:hypothetical protein n=1 Tax=Sphingomonas sp. TaxID=28214 RepID=UPI002BB1447D|nr:hypothetical protein [Sphingomonas sp.]HMI18845.1 hypothetical protein [Sphingomonas sp.]
MIRTLFAAVLIAAMPASAQDMIRGDASAGLVSKTAKAEVHLIADPALNDRRLVLKIVILNLSGAAQPFGPDAVTIAAGDAPIAIASRAALIADLSGAGSASDETAQSHATAALPTNGAGQTDVTSFTGGMNSGVAGIPNSSIDRAQRRPDAKAVAQIDAILLKPMTIRANGADGGQLLTERLKRSKTPEVTVAIAFAGETHHFAVKVPR